MKARIIASLLALTALGVGTLAHAEEDSDPVARQLNRWGVPFTPENVARYYAERGEAMPPQYLDRNAYGPHTLPQVQLATPPAGYVWLPYGINSYAMVNQITGAIAQILNIR